NLKKIWKRLRERERVLEKNGNLSGKNFDFVIFKEIYFEIEFIMGQPLLLCLPTTERRRAQRGKIRRILSSEFGRI
ncbi:MAG: hypothetical protein Q8P57_00940, partial [Candidatus Pacearchaeota archaeon]|nr:hypothetical protein [Candidatus Pacearchaeota archaeon]